MKILIATDGSEASKSIVRAACRLVIKPENTTIRILSAVAPFTPTATESFAFTAEYYAGLEEAAVKQAKISVERAESDLKEICTNIGDISTEVLRGQPARTIVEEAENWGADLIVVGSHGYGFWSRALLGSVSDAVTHHAPCSVLIVRGKE